MVNIENIVNLQREYFFTGETQPVEFRINALKKLKTTLDKYESEIAVALNKDLNKSETEAYLTEINLVKHELSYFIKNTRRLAKEKRVSSTLALFPAKSVIVNEPYGVVLIMSPWNYPYLLAMQTLVGALAAGNTVVIKPSVYALNTSNLINKIITETFDEKYVKVVEGGREENTQLLNQKFDYIFFTGSVNVGKLVMSKASENLTPVTLELGGKSPVIVDSTCNIDLAAKRLAFGKLINAGQTCVAPDYIFVDSSKKSEFINRLIHYIEEFYPYNNGTIEDYPRIINEKHFKRVSSLIEEQNVIYGGICKNDNLFISPTIIDEPALDSPVMSEEIFGPIFPIISYTSLNDVIKEIQKRPKPLALYLFSEDRQTIEYFKKMVSFGGGCINDCLVHLSNLNLPFGGVGNSGMGQYHGKKSFDTFTHHKSLVDKSTLFDIQARYRPYTKAKAKILKKL